MALTDEEMLARILEDDETTKIADSLGIDPVEYAKRVMFYVKNPKAEIQLNVMSPAQEQEHGMPSEAETLAFMKQIESGEISLEGEHQQSRFAGFDDDEKSAVTAAGGQAKKQAPRAEETAPKGNAAPPKVSRGLSKK